MIVQNQIGSGGLSNAELAEATATADQVFKGKTFFAGNDILKTGAFDLSLANAIAAQVLSGYTFYAGDKELKTGTLVPTPKIRTGSFRCVNSELTISCGFKPVCVMLYGDPFYNGVHFGVWSYNGITVGSYFRSSSADIYWESYNAVGLISITNQGFSVDSSQWLVPTYMDIHFIAIG